MYGWTAFAHCSTGSIPTQKAGKGSATSTSFIVLDLKKFKIKSLNEFMLKPLKTHKIASKIITRCGF